MLLFLAEALVNLEHRLCTHQAPDPGQALEKCIAQIVRRPRDAAPRPLKFAPPNLNEQRGIGQLSKASAPAKTAVCWARRSRECTRCFLEMVRTVVAPLLLLLGGPATVVRD